MRRKECHGLDIGIVIVLSARLFEGSMIPFSTAIFSHGTPKQISKRPARSASSAPNICYRMAKVILNRVFGKAVQPIDATVGGNGDPVVIAFAGVLADWAK